MINIYDSVIHAQYDNNNKPVSGSVSIDRLGTLPDVISCTVTEELNGIYEMEMVYVATGENVDLIVADNIIGAMVPVISSVHENYFRIYKIERNIGGRVYIYARHITGELSYNLVSWVSYSPTVAYEAVGTVDDWDLSLRTFCSQFPFTLVGALTSVGGQNLKMPFQNIASVRSYIAGELESPDSNALDLFSCDVVWDQFDIIFTTSRGQARNTLIHYAVNMDGILIDDDLDDVYTSFLLYIRRESGDVYSARRDTTYASLFDYPRTKAVDYSEYVDSEMTDRQAMVWLEHAADAYAQKHNEEGNPVRKIDVDVVAAGIDEELYLGDTVPVVYHRHGVTINTRMRVVAYTWDAIMQRYVSITLGAVKTSLAKEIANGSVAAENSKTLSERIAEVEARKLGCVQVKNSNGIGYKYSDGTLICTKVATVTATLNASWGSLYCQPYSGGQQPSSLGNWPVDFVETPVATASQCNGTDICGISYRDVSATSAGRVWLYRPTSSGSSTYSIALIAVGKWK